MNKFIPAILFLLLAAALYYGLAEKGNKPVAHAIPKSEAASPAKPAQAPADFHVESSFSKEEVEHKFGTTPDKVFYPDTAIDTDEVPSVAIKESVSAETPLHVYQIAADTYMFYGNIAEVDENNRGFNGNAGFVITQDSVVVIDSLGSPKLGKRMIATIRSKTDKPIKYLIITHNHPDHAYGAIAFRELSGVTVIGHEGTMKYIESERIEHSVAYRNSFIKADMQGFKPVKPDILVGGERFSSQRIHTGGKTFDIYNSGAHHSYGDLVVHQVEDKIVWISDLAFNNRVTFMADGHLEQAIEGQDWLLKNFADAKLMVPGHGSAQTPPFPMVGKTQAYMKRLRQAVTDAINNDMELQEAMDTIEFTDWKDVRLYQLNHKKNVDFVYRKLEEELF